MANRFTDSRKWDDPWFRTLPCKYKAFFIFLIDKCDHAGIWKVDFESAKFHIGEEIIKEEVLKIMNGRIVELKEKWFIPKFINFQYQVSSIDDLNPSNRVHKSVLDILIKEGALKGLKRGVQGCKDKDYNKDYDKDNVDGRFSEFWSLYPKQIGLSMACVTFKATVKTEKDFEDIKIALKNYMASDEFKKGYIKNGDRWMEDWKGWLNMKPKQPEFVKP